MWGKIRPPAGLTRPEAGANGWGAKSSGGTRPPCRGRFLRPIGASAGYDGAMRRRAVCLAFASCVVPAVAVAQTVYEPVRYQYAARDGETIYYAGDNPATVARATAVGTDVSDAQHPDRFASAVNRTPRVYTDADPGRDVGPYRLVTSEDVRDEAYARQPRYYRKAAPTTEPVRVEAAAGAWSIEIKPYARPATRPVR